MESQTLEELEETLATYKEQFDQVELALRQAPDEEGLLKVKEDLVEVINLTEDLLRLKKKPVSVPTSASNLVLPQSTTTNTNTTSTTKVAASPSSNVKTEPSTHQGLKIGSRCTALWTEDGNWYEATIDSLPTPIYPKYQVTFVGYGNTGEVTQDQIFPLAETASQNNENNNEDNETNLKDQKEFVVPKYLKIIPTDSDEVRLHKKRRIKAIKSQWRKQQVDDDRNTRKTAWQVFTSTDKKQKTGFGPKKESIFKSPDSVDGKVGVTGSGKPPTPSPVFKATDVKTKKDKLSLPIK